MEMDFNWSFMTHHYHPQRSREGYVFTDMCLSTWGVATSVHAGIPPEQTPPRADTPWEQTPPTLEQTPPTLEQTPPTLEQTPPRSRHPPECTPREQTPPRADTPPGADTPAPPQSRHPSPERRPLLRTVRILLECILVQLNLHSDLETPIPASSLTMTRLNHL